VLPRCRHATDRARATMTTARDRDDRSMIETAAFFFFFFCADPY
jgi:hypothetical protein